MDRNVRGKLGQGHGPFHISPSQPLSTTLQLHLPPSTTTTTALTSSQSPSSPCAARITTAVTFFALLDASIGDIATSRTPQHALQLFRGRARGASCASISWMIHDNSTPRQ